MRVGPRHSHPRGVALVFALFTIAVLITMSATVVGLAIRHGRTGISTSDAESALHAANWGLEATINYMGVGGPSGNWEARGSGYTESFHLKPTEGTSALGGSVLVKVVTQSDPAVATGDTREIKFYNPAARTEEYKLTIDGRTQATVSVLMTEYRIPGQPSHYQLVSTAKVMKPSGEILATRVVEGRVREQSSLDFMHFIQNAKAWDAAGVEPGSDKVKDIVRLPEGYLEKGRMRIDGGGSVPGTAGTVTFQGKGLTPETRWKFTGDVTLGGSQDSIGWTDSDADKNLNTIFLGGLKTSASQKGMPEYDNYMRDMIDGHGGTPPRATKIYKIGGNPATAYADSTGNPQSVPDVVKVAGDARPSIARIRISLDGDRVKIDKVNSLSPGRKEETLYSGPVSGIPNGVVAVQGGNVEVQAAPVTGSGAAKPFTGSLSIVSTDNPGRAQPTSGTGSYPQGNGTIYDDAARTFYTNNPHLPPPYTEKQLYPQSGSPNRYVWPPPASRVEREGNTFITSDIKYGNTGSSPPALGIVAQNYVLLNDSQGKPKLSVDAVLMSLDHSVQFDWDNLAKTGGHTELIKPNMNREFSLNGAIVSSFLDVEGDQVGRGYYQQHFTHDENLRFQLPPFFPHWDRTSATGPGGVTWNWVLMNYVDRGTLNSF